MQTAQRAEASGQEFGAPALKGNASLNHEKKGGKMKRAMIFAAISLLILAFSLNAGAAAPSIYAGAGYAIPMGDFGDAYNGGIGGTAGVGFLINPKFEIG